MVPTSTVKSFPKQETPFLGAGGPGFEREKVFALSCCVAGAGKIPFAGFSEESPEARPRSLRLGIFICYNRGLDWRVRKEHMNRFSLRVALTLILAGASAGLCRASDNYFVGGLGGFAKLSADHRAEVGADSSVTTAYSTFNGPAFMIYFGRHFTDYLSAQVTYGWSRNSLSLSSVRFDSAGGTSYEEERDCPNRLHTSRCNKPPSDWERRALALVPYIRKDRRDKLFRR